MERTVLQRGRKTQGALTVNGDPPRLTPPPNLTTAQRRMFIDLVARCPAKQFAPGDVELLALYVCACVLAQSAVRKAGKDLRALTVWEKSTRAAAMLATRLRLSPQSRTDPKVITRGQMAHPPSVYDIMRLEREANGSERSRSA
jgi:hypothetical protein